MQEFHRADANEDDEVSEKEMQRQLKAELDERTKKKVTGITEFISNCGELKDRPFESLKWDFDAYLRATVRDSLTYDQMVTELVPKNAEVLNDKLNIHHFTPIDAATIRYASPELRRYKSKEIFDYDILYPEEELQALEGRDTFELDEERLEKDEYKYVQVIRGKIERAFTAQELILGIRNPITDIYSNGYGLSELELLMSLITSHLNTEYYNKSYFQQGFSAKGILHVKANLNRSKLEQLRTQWTHLVKGSRNSFQTPIMAGMQEVQWIPLTQNHNEMEFNLWMNYLIKMICAIYQIDPAEIGYAMREEGGSGRFMGGVDNTEAKIQQSKNKGFVPLMTFLAKFINKNIIEKLDPDFKLEWVGLSEESAEAVIARQEKEVKYKKSVNEIREEDDLPPIPGADDLILDTVYFQWFAQFHPDGRKMAEQQMQQEQANMMEQQEGQEEETDPEADYQVEEAKNEAEFERQKEMYTHQGETDAKFAPKEKAPVKKSLSIEYYTIKK